MNELFLIFYALAIAAFSSARLILPSRRKYLYALTLVFLCIGLNGLPLNGTLERFFAILPL